MQKKKSRVPGVHLERAVNGEFYWYAVGDNMKVTATSETYKRRQGALKNMASTCNTLNSAVGFNSNTGSNVVHYYDHTRLEQIVDTKSATELK